MKNKPPTQNTDTISGLRSGSIVSPRTNNSPMSQGSHFVSHLGLTKVVVLINMKNHQGVCCQKLMHTCVAPSSNARGHGLITIPTIVIDRRLDSVLFRLSAAAH